MQHLFKDAPAGSWVPPPLAYACLCVLLVSLGPFYPIIERLEEAHPFETLALFVAIIAAISLLRRVWARWRGVAFVSPAELEQRLNVWQAAHPLWPVSYLPLAIGWTVYNAEAHAGLPFWLLQWQDWLIGISQGLVVFFAFWLYPVVRRGLSR